MTCKCESTDSKTIIKFICDDMEDLDDDKRWDTYLDRLPDKYKTASIRWSLTKTNTRIWFARVLQNMEKEDLIVWAHNECFCMDQA